jgi:hypothetical protein
MPADINLRRGMFSLVLLGFCLKPAEGKVDSILAMKRVPVDHASAEEEPPEKVTPLLLFHDAYDIGIVRKKV